MTRCSPLPWLPLAACLLLLLSCLTGCDGVADEQTELTVMTRNLYLGGNLNLVLSAQTPEQIPERVARLYADVLASDVPARAAAIADEIDAARPDLIGLQEVALFRIQDPSDYFDGTTAPNAEDVVLDFLALLQFELTRRGHTYLVAHEVANTDVELPAEGMTGLFDVRLTDRDVILARPEVQLLTSAGDHYAVNQAVLIGGPEGAEVRILRGYGWVEARVGRASLTFVNTHLEVGGLAASVQEAQAAELLQTLETFPDPVVLVGDFNSAADSSTTATYALLTAQFTDAFAMARPGEDGYTCCQRPDLLNEASVLSTRIDLILYRGPVEAAQVRLVGASPLDRIDGLWPSDHAGVVATLEVEN